MNDLLIIISNPETVTLKSTYFFKAE